MTRSPSFSEIQAIYHYELPPELIATTPASPRDSARLLIYDRKKDNVSFDIFHNIGSYIPKNAVLVLNDTKVFPARMTFKKSTGGKIEALFLETLSKKPLSEHHRRGLACQAPTDAAHNQIDSPSFIRVLATGKLRPNEILRWEDVHSFRVIERNGKAAVLLPYFPISALPSLLDKHGHIPLPPYIEKSPLSEIQRRREYQTVFARDSGSIAAPTAGLHFTEELLESLKDQGIDIEFVTLHVHLGTFAPLEEEQWKKRQLHTEYYAIDPKTAERLNTAKKQSRPIVAVGTTTVRTLESAIKTSAAEDRDLPLLRQLNGDTSLFLTEDSPLHFVNHVITNFHLPGTSLLMLVAAFTGKEKLMELYKKAVDERMRFYSFGDGMLVI